jgi:aspartyl-tRNA(Asn)/glutamyl-tRNA(Gln) amidotransferase subunit B
MFTPIIGLEIHLQLNTKSKVFCSCSTSEAPPNTNVCEICLAYPGAMPNLNQEAVKQAIKMGLALNLEIAKVTNWDRKNYMYPDLFKGYQISQLDQPICGEGELEILVRDRKNFYSKDNYTKTIGIFRAHLEEDTAKSLHQSLRSGGGHAHETLLDANKAGIPLLEIVTKPEMYSVDEAVSFAKEVRNLARWFGISDCNLELGQMRFDANVSVCIDDVELKGKKYEEWKGARFTPIVEIKNLNSFGFLESALIYEIERQIEEYKKTCEVYVAGSKETRGWDDKVGKTFIQRKKEEANEYRYIPEPDIPELEISQHDLDEIQSNLPKSPQLIRKDLIEKGVSEQSARVITGEKVLFDTFTILSEDQKLENYAKIANIITNDLSSEIIDFADQYDFSEFQLFIKDIKYTIDSLLFSKISANEYKEILKNHKKFERDWKTQTDNLLQNSLDIDIESILKKAISENPNVVQQIKDGKDSAKMFFVGIVMRESKGKANPNEVKEIIDRLVG